MVLDEGMSTNGSSIQGRQQLECFLQLFPRIAVELWLAEFVEDFLVWRVYTNIQLSWQCVQSLNGPW